MKIAINCMFCTPESGGIKEYIVNLTHNLYSIDNENEYVFYALEDHLDYVKCQLPSSNRIKAIPYKSGLLSKINRSLFSQSYWSREEEMEQFDIFHSPFFYAPKFKSAKLIITVHDMRLYRFPNTYPFLRLIFLRYSVKNSLKRADTIIAVSQFTKNEIIECCKINDSKIKVILEAIDRASFSTNSLSDYSLPIEYKQLEKNRFLFSLGHVEPRKNYIRLLEAFKLMKANPKFYDLKLVIAGRLNWKSKKVKSAFENTNDVIYLNFIPRDFLLWLYKNATLFVFPSYYEGFGFPPLEAACLGCVSAVSNVSSIPEVCGDSAFYFDPFNAKDICKTISSCLDNPEQIEIKRSCLVEQLEKFSWRENAKQTLEVYRCLVGIQ